ncbi:unnamed protein product [Sphenostylis stenocarpa]|uniref:Uncharacterized protein n=1 Tax=Sphenostylis stenocarpa TaxID=92480 RepID=A0AA86VL10_9FABA|nr:unnamed protein product [Sphenostylis stenocarpa]
MLAAMKEDITLELGSNKKAKPSTLLFELVLSYYSRGIVVGMIMEFRSKSCRDERLQIESNGGGKVAPTSMQDLRCQSAKNASSGCAHQIGSTGKEVKVKRGKRTAAKPSKSWSFSDPELQRKKRVAGYKIYAAEGKMKGSLRKSFRTSLSTREFTERSRTSIHSERMRGLTLIPNNCIATSGYSTSPCRSTWPEQIRTGQLHIPYTI